jgi:vacuolar iron transporter family protein
MKKSAIKGFSFGLTSGIITTLGMMVGLYAGTGSKLAVLGGILSIAIADSFSDAMGIHLSEESEGKKSHKQIWVATISTLASKLIFSSMFILPVVLFSLFFAITISIIWGLSLLSILSYFMAREKKANPLGVILEHLSIAILVILATHFVGEWLANTFI